MASGDYLKEKEILLNMEVKLRLLDLEGMELPASAPVIPPPPPNLNFSLNNWPRADHSLTSFYWKFTNDDYYFFVKRLSSEKGYLRAMSQGVPVKQKGDVFKQKLHFMNEKMRKNVFESNPNKFTLLTLRWRMKLNDLQASKVVAVIPQKFKLCVLFALFCIL